ERGRRNAKPIGGGLRGEMLRCRPGGFGRRTQRGGAPCGGPDLELERLELADDLCGREVRHAVGEGAELGGEVGHRSMPGHDLGAGPAGSSYGVDWPSRARKQLHRAGPGMRSLSLRVALAALLCLPGSARPETTPASPDGARIHIKDNSSFFIEEAYNQEAGVVQHILHG